MHWLQLGSGGEAPPARSDAILEMLSDRKLVVAGGWTACSGLEHRNDAWVFDVTSGTWAEMATSGTAPPQLSPQCARWHSGLLISWAGHGSECHRSHLWMLDPRSPRWIRQLPKWRSPGMPSYLDDAAQTADPSLGPLVFGGDDGCYSNKLQQLDCRSWGWLRVSPMGTPPTPRHSHAQALDLEHKRLYVVGGHDGRSCGDVWRVNLCGRMRWERVVGDGAEPSPRVSSSAWCVSSRLYCFGGFYGDSYLPQTSVLAIGEAGGGDSKAADTWVSVKTAQPAPCGRSGAACTGYHTDQVSDSGETQRVMFVFGGYDGKRYLSDLHVMQTV